MTQRRPWIRWRDEGPKSPHCDLVVTAIGVGSESRSRLPTWWGPRSWVGAAIGTRLSNSGWSRPSSRGAESGFGKARPHVVLILHGIQGHSIYGSCASWPG
jgi:hypothetical protein